MRIALIGYGRMGKEIEQLALTRGIQVTAKVDSRNPSLQFGNFDVAFHFASPTSVVNYVEACADAKKSIVVGTTGWSKDLGKVRSIVEKNKVGLVHSSNFSIGMNVYFLLAKDSGRLFDKFPEYDVFIQEIHHKDKVDTPSGTALTLAGILMQHMKRKKEILNAPPLGAIEPEQLHIASTRAGSVVGTHRLTFDSPSDTIVITHHAKNRSGFAMGALLAAQWIQNNQGMFTMEDVIFDLMK